MKLAVTTPTHAIAEDAHTLNSTHNATSGFHKPRQCMAITPKNETNKHPCATAGLI
ncbi:hypothetical protein PSEUDO9AZ_11211 [Pseudomonas sp. 9AZ]|nr:hypothetical protein PSEUDO9AZ_11211 [Pseudomonas sp. 9AZ]